MSREVFEIKIYIGNAANIFKISAQTLRYYDKINLFKPRGIEDNGYRYYTFEQLDELDIILFLKKTGMSLDHIREYMEKRSAQNSIELLEEQNLKLTDQINELKIMQKTLNRKVEYIKKWVNVDRCKEIEVRNIPKRHVISIKNTSKLNFEEFMQESLLSAMDVIQINQNLFNNAIGVTVEKNDLMQSNYQRYNSMYIEIEKKSNDEQYVEILEGEYLCMYHSGPYENTPKTYSKMMSYIKANGFKVTGDAIEDSLIYSFFAKDEQDFLTEIQIPIKR